MPYPPTEGPVIKSALQVIESKFDAKERMADELFKDGKYVEAIRIYQKIIEEGYSVDFEIAGLGNA
jgi:pentatricopeptide repeat protein